MSLATQLMKKFAATRYPLYYEQLDVTVYLQPLTFGQRQAAQKIKTTDKQHQFVFSIAVFDEAGEPVVSKLEEVDNLPELFVGLCCSTVFQLTNGASHATCDKVVTHFLKSVNITEDEVEQHEAESAELDAVIEEETSLKNA